MKFLALLRKELWECLPWILLAAIVFFVMGGFFLRAVAYQGGLNWHYSRLSPGSTVDPYRLTYPSPLQVTGIWLFCSSIGLGLVLGIRQFWIPHFTRTWPFLLHRSVGRKTILAVKLAAAIIGFIISLGILWVALYWYACQPELFTVPQPVRVFIEGWLFIVLGLVVYLGAALSGLSTARWYTTKIFGLAFATIVISTTIVQWRLAWAFAVIIIGAAVLLSQIVDTFLRREF